MSGMIVTIAAFPFETPIVSGCGADESTSLCSLSTLSHLSSDAINSVTQSPEYPPRSSLRHSATFDEGTKSMSEKAKKKKKSKNLFKRLLYSSNGGGGKGKAANVTFYQSQPGIPERTSTTDDVTNEVEEPKDYSKDVSTFWHPYPTSGIINRAVFLLYVLTNFW